MKKIFVILILLSVLQLSLLANIPASERQALIDLYNSTTGTDWINKTNWLGAAGTENTWFGVTTDAGNTTVVSIVLLENNLAGTLSSSLGNLSNLIQLDLSYNQLKGAIPVNFGNLTLLQICNLCDNLLSGPIPVELGNAKSLQQLTLNVNQFTGAIPSSLGNLTMLNWLDLGSNTLYSTIPVELGKAISLQRLSLDFNRLTGAIPKEFGKLTDLTTLYLRDNHLSGTIPAEIGNLTKLWVLELRRNALSGAIPAELGNLKDLLELDLSFNQLIGTIPVSLELLSSLDPMGGTDIGYNALHTSDAGLIQFLNSKDVDWAATQTIAPLNLKATAQSSTSVLLSWTAIPFSEGMGAYYIYYSLNPAGPWITNSGGPLTKKATSFPVGGLAVNTTYYFKMRTMSMIVIDDVFPTWSIVSEDSEIVSAKTSPKSEGNWKIGTKYKVNDCVVYDSKTWRCIYAHTAQANWYPGAPGIYFWTLIDVDGQWHSGIAYKVGDVVQYKGVYWQCVFAHTSQSDWYPGAPDFWFWKKI